MNYGIQFYDESVQRDIEALPMGLRVRFTLLAERMKVFGSNLGEPHTKAMSNGLFEMRLKSAEGIARVFYCTLLGRKIVMLHSFIKKTDKTPTKELMIAKTRMNVVKLESDAI